MPREKKFDGIAVLAIWIEGAVTASLLVGGCFLIERVFSYTSHDGLLDLWLGIFNGYAMRAYADARS